MIRASFRTKKVEGLVERESRREVNVSACECALLFLLASAREAIRADFRTIKMPRRRKRPERATRTKEASAIVGTRADFNTFNR